MTYVYVTRVWHVYETRVSRAYVTRVSYVTLSVVCDESVTCVRIKSVITWPACMWRQHWLVSFACHIRRAFQSILRDWLWLASFMVHIWQLGDFEERGKKIILFLFWYFLSGHTSRNCRNMDLENEDSQGTDGQKLSRWASRPTESCLLMVLHFQVDWCF